MVDLANGSLKALSSAASGAPQFTVISTGGDLYTLSGLAAGTPITVQATIVGQGTGLITENGRSGGAMVQIQRGSGGAPSAFDQRVFQAPFTAPLGTPFTITESASISFPATIGDPFPLVYFLRLDTASGTTFDFLNTATLNFNLPQGVTIASVGGFTTTPSTAVPEPGTLTLVGLGMAMSFVVRKFVT